jgi:hypothetical protein
MTQARSTTAGLHLGEAVTDKVGLYGVTPIVQRAGAAQAAVGAATYAAPDATPAAITGGESPTEAEHNALRSAHDSLRTQVIALAADNAAQTVLINEMRAALVALGAFKGAA